MAKKFNFEPLPKVEQSENKSLSESIEQKKQSELTKVSFYLESELKDKVQDFGYWEGYTQQDVIILALEDFLSKKDIKERPEAIKNKKTAGRKKKIM